jgi:hypothetical protein
MNAHRLAHLLWWLRLRDSLHMSDGCGWCWRNLRREMARP